VTVLSVSGDEEVAVSISERNETLDHRMEEAQKGTPVLPHFQYTRASFKLNMNRNRVKFCENFMYRERCITFAWPTIEGPIRHKLPQYPERL
jgi:hypothetical protein